MSKKCNAQVESKPCVRSSFAVCEGCHQPFCFLHLSAHQQELAIQMEGIIGDHDLLREELNKPRIYSQEDMPNFVHEFSLIDAWQTHTLAQVTKVVTQEADRARNVIRTIMDEKQRRATSNTVAITEEFERLKKRLAMLSEQLQERMKTSEYLEPDLRQWQNQLTDIKKCSVTPRVCTDAIVNKLIVRETRQININVSNILDINYEDAERSKASNNEKKTNSLGGTAKTKVTERYNSTTYRDEDLDDDGDDEMHNTSNNVYGRTSSVEAYDHIAEKMEQAVIFNSKIGNKNRRIVKR